MMGELPVNRLANDLFVAIADDGVTDALGKGNGNKRATKTSQDGVEPALGSPLIIRHVLDHADASLF